MTKFVQATVILFLIAGGSALHVRLDANDVAENEGKDEAEVKKKSRVSVWAMAKGKDDPGAFAGGAAPDLICDWHHEDETGTFPEPHCPDLHDDKQPSCTSSIAGKYYYRNQNGDLGGGDAQAILTKCNAHNTWYQHGAKSYDEKVTCACITLAQACLEGLRGQFQDDTMTFDQLTDAHYTAMASDANYADDADMIMMCLNAPQQAKMRTAARKVMRTRKVANKKSDKANIETKRQAAKNTQKTDKKNSLPGKKSASMEEAAERGAARKAGNLAVDSGNGAARKAAAAELLSEKQAARDAKRSSTKATNDNKRSQDRNSIRTKRQNAKADALAKSQEEKAELRVSKQESNVKDRAEKKASEQEKSYNAMKGRQKTRKENWLSGKNSKEASNKSRKASQLDASKERHVEALAAAQAKIAQQKSDASTNGKAKHKQQHEQDAADHKTRYDTDLSNRKGQKAQNNKNLADAKTARGDATVALGHARQASNRRRGTSITCSYAADSGNTYTSVKPHCNSNNNQVQVACDSTHDGKYYYQNDAADVGGGDAGELWGGCVHGGWRDHGAKTYNAKHTCTCVKSSSLIQLSEEEEEEEKPQPVKVSEAGELLDEDGKAIPGTSPKQ